MGQMVLKIKVHTMQKSGLERSHLGYTMINSDKIRSNGPVRSQFWYTIQKLGQMVLKGVNWVHNDKIRSNGLERRIGYTIQMVKGVNWVHNVKWC